MKKAKKVLNLLILLVLIGVFNVNISNAKNTEKLAFKEELRDQSAAFWEKTGYDSAEPDEVGIITAQVIQAFLGLLGIIFVILIIYGGYLWMTSRGNEEQVKKAKDTLQKATIGLIIILAAYAITYFVFTELPFSGGSGETSVPGRGTM